MVAPQVFDELIESIERLEDILEGRLALAEIRSGEADTIDAEEAFNELGI